MKNYSVAAIFFVCSHLVGYSQFNDASVAQKFEAYQSLWPKTKLHLIFNQNKFSPGDTAWFKAYFLTENLTGVKGKQLIELNLVDSQGRSKFHLNFIVLNGIAQNQMIIPDTVSVGIYLVTAHSNWMKNFGPDFIFRKEISIVSNYKLMLDESPVFSAAVEGGHLVRDISNRVIIKTNRTEIEVQIIDVDENEIAQASTDTNGFASLNFIPKRNVPYFVRMLGVEGLPRISLPAVENDGFGLLVSTAKKNEPVKVIVRSPSDSPLRKEGLIIIVSCQGKIYHSEEFLFNGKDFIEFNVNQDDLPEGVAHVSVLDQAGILLASRDFYSHGKDVVQAEVQLSKQLFQIRDKVSLNVSLTDGKGQPVEGEFSVKVLNSGLFDLDAETSLTDESTIFSDANEKFHIDRSDSNWLTRLDNFLIHATKPLPWKEILSKEISQPKFPFTSRIERSGIAYFPDTLEPVPDLTQIMFYLQRDKMHYQTFAMNMGRVALTVPDIFEQDEFFYLAQILNGKEIKNLQVKWQDQPIELPHSSNSKELDTPDLYASFIAKKRLIDKSFGLYSSFKKLKSVDLNLRNINDFENEIAEADIIIDIKDYITFPTMDELLREVVPGIFHRKIGKQSIVRVKNLEPNINAADPLYVIDGIATKSTDFFLALKPSDLLTIKIINSLNKLKPLGLLGKNGIVIVQTKMGNVREPVDDRSKLIEGLSRPLNFKTSDYSQTSNTHVPDFRSTIYWNPSVRTNSSGLTVVDFFCSDDVGKLTIYIEGIATGGRPFSTEQNVKVSLSVEKK